MKTKMFKKIIAVVCAATMATSFSAMSVGALRIIPVNWAQSYNAATNFVDRACGVTQNQCGLQDCVALADDLEAFFNGPACHVILRDVDPGRRAVLLDGFRYILTNLRSHDLEQRRLGAYYSIDFVSDLEELIEQHTH